MNNELKIGFIGFGNMAQAMAKGLLAMDVCQSSQIFACAAHFDKLQKLSLIHIYWAGKSAFWARRQKRGQYQTTVLKLFL